MDKSRSREIRIVTPARIALVEKTMKNGARTSVGHDEGVASGLALLPDEQFLDCARFQCEHRLLRAVAVQGTFRSIASHLFHELLQKSLLLDQARAREGVCGDGDGLLQSLLHAVRDVHHLQNDLRQTRIEELAVHQLVLRRVRMETREQNRRCHTQ